MKWESNLASLGEIDIMSTEQANFNRLFFKTKMYVTITLWKKCVLELGW